MHSKKGAATRQVSGMPAPAPVSACLCNMHAWRSMLLGHFFSASSETVMGSHPLSPSIIICCASDMYVHVHKASPGRAASSLRMLERWKVLSSDMHAQHTPPTSSPDPARMHTSPLMDTR
eukprot:361381-Chlamydomonas_euryale.AAC.6